MTGVSCGLKTDSVGEVLGGGGQTGRGVAVVGTWRLGKECPCSRPASGGREGKLILLEVLLSCRESASLSEIWTVPQRLQTNFMCLVPFLELGIFYGKFWIWALPENMKVWQHQACSHLAPLGWGRSLLLDRTSLPSMSVSIWVVTPPKECTPFSKRRWIKQLFINCAVQ